LAGNLSSIAPEGLFDAIHGLGELFRLVADEEFPPVADASSSRTLMFDISSLMRRNLLLFGGLAQTNA
jgi:hypothetical protein